MVIRKGEGDIADLLLKQAKALGTDLIIMGGKGHSKMELLLMGSRTERMLNINDSIPTLIVK